MSLIERMNPLICINGSTTSTLKEASDEKEADTSDGPEDISTASNSGVLTNDLVQSETSQCQNSLNKIMIGAKSGKSIAYGCINPLRSKYKPDDTTEESIHSPDALDYIVPELIECISFSSLPLMPQGSSKKQMKKAVKESHARRSGALEKIYELTKKDKEYNRIPLVCTKKWDIIGALTEALISSQEQSIEGEESHDKNSDSNLYNHKSDLDEDRRLICWTFNNLSIPYENKATIIEGKNFSKMLQALTKVVDSNLPEAYLCCIFFMNLTFLAHAIRPVVLYMPLILRDVGKSIMPSSFDGIGALGTRVLDDSNSLLRTVERLLIANSPSLMKPIKSVQGEAIRWACGFIRNVTFLGEVSVVDHNINKDRSNDSSYGDNVNNSSNNDTSSANDYLSGNSGRQGVISRESIEEICTLISTTEIPRLLVHYVRDSPYPTIKWTKDSLEDISLGVICNLAQWTSSREALRRAGAVQSLEKIEGLAGIHGYRARAIRCSLGALPLQMN